MKPELIVLILALVLVVAVANTPSLSSEVRLILFLLALVAIILAGLHDQGMMQPRPPTRSSVTEAEARNLLRDCDGQGGLEAWMAARRWKTAPGGWAVTLNCD
jgi:hypothetical protein